MVQILGNKIEHYRLEVSSYDSYYFCKHIVLNYFWSKRGWLIHSLSFFMVFTEHFILQAHP